MTLVSTVIHDYVAGLKAHDVARIANTVSDDLAFVAVARTMTKRQFLAFLRALYAGFPDWHYDHDPAEVRADGSIAIRWRQGGTHTGTLALPGFDAVPPTGRNVAITEQFFFYRVTDGRIAEIRPDPVPGGAPRGIFEQIGVPLPPL
jgi:predicted ester cyclase